MSRTLQELRCAAILHQQRREGNDFTRPNAIANSSDVIILDAINSRPPKFEPGNSLIMNIVLQKVGICALLILVAVTVVVAKDWRGIVPLKSTRADVERLLGPPHRSSESTWFYKLSNEIVVFSFEIVSCDSWAGKCGIAWNVPPGTVKWIGVIPRGNHRKDEYLIAGDPKVYDTGSGFIQYSDNSAGLFIETYQNRVTLVNYEPKASDENLRCPRINECIVDFVEFDEYEKPSFEDEKARLENFLIAVNNSFGRGTIEVVGPNKTARQKRMKRASRASRYGLKKLGLEEERILIIDGGFSEGPLTRLSVYAIGGPGSVIFLYPEKDR